MMIYKNNITFIILFYTTIAVFFYFLYFCVSNDKKKDKEEVLIPIFNETFPIKIICNITSYLALEDYIYDNFPNTEVIFYDKNNTLISCEKCIHYISIVNVPYLMNSYEYALYKTNILDKTSDLYEQDLCNSTKINPIVPEDCKVSLLNTEHLSNKGYLKYMKKYLSPQIDVYDFSKKNIELLGRGYHIPYKNDKNTENYLRSFIKQKKHADVCIVGNISDRRKRIIENLSAQGITLDVIKNKFRIHRDARVGGCKLLLNVHMYDKNRIYEALRCERWRFAGMPIISETCMDEVPEGIITCDYDKIVETVKDVLRKMNN